MRHQTRLTLQPRNAHWARPPSRPSHPSPAMRQRRTYAGVMCCGAVAVCPFRKSPQLLPPRPQTRAFSQAAGRRANRVRELASCGRSCRGWYPGNTGHNSCFWSSPPREWHQQEILEPRSNYRRKGTCPHQTTHSSRNNGYRAATDTSSWS